MHRIAFIDNKPVPCKLTPAQILASFPAGLAGLHEDVPGFSAAGLHGAPTTALLNLLIMPAEDGTVVLQPGRRYTVHGWDVDGGGAAEEGQKWTQPGQGAVLHQRAANAPAEGEYCGAHTSSPEPRRTTDNQPLLPPSPTRMRASSAADDEDDEDEDDTASHLEDNVWRVAAATATSAHDTMPSPIPLHDEVTDARSLSPGVLNSALQLQRTFASDYDRGATHYVAAQSTTAAQSTSATEQQHQQPGQHPTLALTAVAARTMGGTTTGLVLPRTRTPRRTVAHGGLCPALRPTSGDIVATQRASSPHVRKGDKTTVCTPHKAHRTRSASQPLRCSQPPVSLQRREREQVEDMRLPVPVVPVPRCRESKLIKDCLYEHVQLPMPAMHIIDTPEFQHLRQLKQLGTTFFLYPGATHTRFEHCIGVAHLASQMVQHFATCQPELRINKADILCVTIAGLCHDLGHGPFSHLFEQVVDHILSTTTPAASETAAATGGDFVFTPPTALRSQTQLSATPRTAWRHEWMSIRLLRRILARVELEEWGLNDSDARFIELCITGLAADKPWPRDVGRPAHKRFLVDIVANKRNGIDVDKLDYFLRDSHGVYGRAAVDVNFPRILSASRVLVYEDQWQICYEEKMALSLGEIFALRAKLHKHVYQHRIVKVIDHMVRDVLAAANPYFFMRGSNGTLCRISDCVNDEDAFCRLGDWVLQAIAASPHAELVVAQRLIARLHRRELYTIAGSATFSLLESGLTERQVKADLVDIILRMDDQDGVCDVCSGEDGARDSTSKSSDDEDDSEAEEGGTLVERLQRVLIVTFTRITYGSSDDMGRPANPINDVTFFNPKNMDLGAFKLARDRVSPLFSPSEYCEQSVMVLVRNDRYAKMAVLAFDEWKRRNSRYLIVGVPSFNAAGLTPHQQRHRTGSVSVSHKTGTKRARVEGTSQQTGDFCVNVSFPRETRATEAVVHGIRRLGPEAASLPAQAATSVATQTNTLNTRRHTEHVRRTY